MKTWEWLATAARGCQVSRKENLKLFLYHMAPPPEGGKILAWAQLDSPYGHQGAPALAPRLSKQAVSVVYFNTAGAVRGFNKRNEIEVSSASPHTRPLRSQVTRVPSGASTNDGRAIIHLTISVLSHLRCPSPQCAGIHFPIRLPISAVVVSSGS